MKAKHLLPRLALGIALLFGTGCESGSDSESGNEIRGIAASARSYYEEELLVAVDAGSATSPR